MNTIDLERSLKALANRKRLMILKELKKRGSMNVSTIAKVIGLSMQATSTYLQRLSVLGIVTSKKRRQTVFYRLSLNQNPPNRHILSLL